MDAERAASTDRVQSGFFRKSKYTNGYADSETVCATDDCTEGETESETGAEGETEDETEGETEHVTFAALKTHDGPAHERPAAVEAGRPAKVARTRSAAASASLGAPAQAAAAAIAAAPRPATMAKRGEAAAAAAPAATLATASVPPPAAKRGKKSRFTAAEKEWIAAQCSKFFSGAVVHAAPTLEFVRDDIALHGLAELRFQEHVDPDDKEEFHKFVYAVLHVAKTWPVHAALRGNAD